jgi:hypothetical protein
VTVARRPHVLALAAGVIALLAIAACSSGHATLTVERVQPPTATQSPHETTPPALPSPTDPKAAAVPSSLRGTAAEAWARGTVGLGEPPARPPRGMSEATLDRAVAYAQGQLVAGNLDLATVYRRDTKPFIAATAERNRVDHLDLLASPAAGGRPYALVSRLPDDARSDGDVRIKGSYAIEVKTTDGERYMSLTWRGTFLYPVRDADGRSTAVIVHRRATWNWADDPTWAPGEHWYFEIGNVDQCATQRSGLLVPDYTADHLAQAVAAPYGGGVQADNTDELAERC